MIVIVLDRVRDFGNALRRCFEGVNIFGPFGEALESLRIDIDARDLIREAIQALRESADAANDRRVYSERRAWSWRMWSRPTERRYAAPMLPAPWPVALRAWS